MNSVFIHSHKLSKFSFGPGHPYNPERANLTMELCSRFGVIDQQWIRIAEPALLGFDLPRLFHEDRYLELLREADIGKPSIEMLAHGIGTEDNPILPGIYDWSAKTAGATQMGMEFLAEGKVDLAFNPLGGFHHAHPARAAGFCYLNDIGIALRWAFKRGLRVAYVDIDAHHCDGVQSSFYDEDRALVISLHETGESLFPGTGRLEEIGEAKGRGFNVNLPLLPGTDDETYTFAFRRIIPPLLAAFNADVLVAQIGADSLAADPLSHLSLTNNGYQEVLRLLRFCSPKTLLLGGGGYAAYQTARCWTLAWALFNGLTPQNEFIGSVGGMMFGPEKEVGSLYDAPSPTSGYVKEKAYLEAERVVAWIEKNIFPLHHL